MNTIAKTEYTGTFASPKVRSLVDRMAAALDDDSESSRIFDELVDAMITARPLPSREDLDARITAIQMRAWQVLGIVDLVDKSVTAIAEISIDDYNQEVAREVQGRATSGFTALQGAVTLLRRVALDLDTNELLRVQASADAIGRGDAAIAARAAAEVRP